MELPYSKVIPQSGFSYELTERNKALVTKAGVQPPKVTSTGTTIVGCLFNGGVILATDTRATGGSMVHDKNCQKLHYMAPNIYCAGAGTAADCDHATEMIKRDLELHRLNTGEENRVNHCVHRLKHHLFRYMGHCGCALIIGGVDVKGPVLCEIDPHGHTQYNPFLTMGSGSLSAMAILESEYKDDMTQDEAVALCTKAIEAGIYYDLGSGSNVDVGIITREGLEMRRSVKSDNRKMYSNPAGYQFPPGTTEVIKTSNIPLEISQGAQPMEL